MNYYNEFDPFAAEWLAQLMKEGIIPNGKVDTRSIIDVQPSDLAGFAQCHFFAGIGGWSHALRLAGWPDDRRVWTGSCPCQPFSVAGKGKGTADERHLWPEFHRLIRECKPAIVFGEQVASRAGREWFAGVRADLEDVGYGAAAADLCAAGVGAPHIRQRLYWCAMADANAYGRLESLQSLSGKPAERSGCSCIGSGMGDADLSRPQEYWGFDELYQRQGREGTLGPAINSNMGDRKPNSTFWSGSEWITGFDGKSRRIEPSIPLLANGVPNRVGLLRGFGNAIVPQVAAEVIKPFMGTGVY